MIGNTLTSQSSIRFVDEIASESDNAPIDSDNANIGFIDSYYYEPSKGYRASWPYIVFSRYLVSDFSDFK